jgi:DNA-binding transcriptional regulator YiaG
MSTSSLKERFARLGPFQAVDRVQDGSPAVLSLRPLGGMEPIETISATLALAKRGLSLEQAKQAIEALLDTGRCVVAVPLLDDISVMAAELEKHGIAAHAVARAPVDVRQIRHGLGLTQEEFALQFGLDPKAVRNWEDHGETPDLIAESYLRAIARFPTETRLAQEDSVG